MRDHPELIDAGGASRSARNQPFRNRPPRLVVATVWQRSTGLFQGEIHVCPGSLVYVGHAWGPVVECRAFIVASASLARGNNC